MGNSLSLCRSVLFFLCEFIYFGSRKYSICHCTSTFTCGQQYFSSLCFELLSHEKKIPDMFTLLIVDYYHYWINNLFLCHYKSRLFFNWCIYCVVNTLFTSALNRLFFISVGLKIIDFPSSLWYPIPFTKNMVHKTTEITTEARNVRRIIIRRETGF